MSESPPLQRAPLWKRLASLFYDLWILVAISFLYFAILTLIAALLGRGKAHDYLPTVHGIFAQLGWLATILGFYIFFWMRVGQTVAMKAWNLRLISSENKKLSFLQCCCYAVAGFLSLACCGLGYFWMLIDKDKKALHDRLCKTEVVVLPKVKK